MKCAACGFDNFDHAVTCMGCGQALTEVQELPPPEPLTEAEVQELGLYEPKYYEQIDIGSVVSESFGIYFRNFVPFFAITFLAYSPLFALTLWAAYGDTSGLDESVVVMVVGLGGIAALMLAFPFATAALTFGVLQSLRDRHPGIGECLAVGIRMMITVIAVAVLQWFATLGGFLLLIIPGVIISVALSVAVPAAVEERPGAFKALRRSFELTKGNRWQIFGVFFCLGLINALLQALVWGATALSPTAGWIVDMLRSILYTGVSATAAALLYYQHRSVKESLYLNELASVFD